ncbi:hypothetical protein FB451DRAFT_1178568 [Mycena latifolia]|nr:hypothetical protein FB451DRAFT_1178568 [Mycena latifolia]
MECTELYSIVHSAKNSWGLGSSWLSGGGPIYDSLGAEGLPRALELVAAAIVSWIESKPNSSCAVAETYWQARPHNAQRSHGQCLALSSDGQHYATHSRLTRRLQFQVHKNGQDEAKVASSQSFRLLVRCVGNDLSVLEWYSTDDGDVRTATLSDSDSPFNLLLENPDELQHCPKLNWAPAVGTGFQWFVSRSLLTSVPPPPPIHPTSPHRRRARNILGRVQTVTHSGDALGVEAMYRALARHADPMGGSNDPTRGIPQLSAAALHWMWDAHR